MLPINSNIHFKERMRQKELEKQQKEEADRQRQAAEEAKRKEAMELLSMSMGCKVTGTIFSPWTEFYTLFRK